MELDFNILRCNPIVAPIREKRLEENKRATVFSSFFRLHFWAKGAGNNSVTVFCKVLYPASGLPWELACIWETLQGTHWYAETNGIAPLGSLSEAAQIPKRQGKAGVTGTAGWTPVVSFSQWRGSWFNGPGMEAWVPIPAFTLTWFVALAMLTLFPFSHLHNTRSDHWLRWSLLVLAFWV